jgi:hypothetical protein
MAPGPNLKGTSAPTSSAMAANSELPARRRSVPGAAAGDGAQLYVPVPENLTASYLVPLPTVVPGAEVRHQAVEAVEARVNGPIRLLILEWIFNDAVTIQVTAPPDRIVPVPNRPDGLTAEQLAHLTGHEPSPR